PPTALYTLSLHDALPISLQGLYPPGSTWKLATAVLGLQDDVVNTESRMPQACNGYYYFGNRAWHCWEKAGHGSLTLTQAISRSRSEEHTSELQSLAYLVC